MTQVYCGPVIFYAYSFFCKYSYMFLVRYCVILTDYCNQVSYLILVLIKVVFKIHFVTSGDTRKGVVSTLWSLFCPSNIFYLVVYRICIRVYI